MAKQEDVKKTSKKELPDLTGKEFPRTCTVRDLLDDQGPIPFYLIKRGSQRSRVFPQDTDRFIAMLRDVEEGAELVKTGYLVETEKLEDEKDESKKKGDSSDDLDNLMSRLGLGTAGVKEEKESETPSQDQESEEAVGEVKTNFSTNPNSLSEQERLLDSDEENSPLEEGESGASPGKEE
jgi:hypothetical protein